MSLTVQRKGYEARNGSDYECSQEGPPPSGVYDAEPRPEMSRIAARIGRDTMTVSRIWNRWAQDGNTERCA
ncbi:hypothetical protein TNCV_2862421 [Trichonephila clavipes]|nr:hypothetical protein TNCV_2862421 [Trichonephila clavipes]